VPFSGLTFSLPNAHSISCPPPKQTSIRIRDTKLKETIYLQVSALNWLSIHLFVLVAYQLFRNAVHLSGGKCKIQIELILTNTGIDGLLKNLIRVCHTAHASYENNPDIPWKYRSKLNFLLEI
jgi:hypothetical protein